MPILFSSSRKIMEITKTPSISIFILYPLLIILFFTTIQARKLDETSCSSSCGEIQNITYPFRLKTDPSSCGVRDYELSCLNNKTILDFHGGKYFVQKITYDIHRIRIVDVNFANGSCNIPSGRLKSVHELDIDYRYPGYTNLSSVGFMNCSRNISTSNNFTRVPCSSRNGSFVYAVHYNSYTMPELNRTYCKPMSMAPIDYYPENGKLNSSFDSILKPLQSGFELLWSVECRDCSLLDRHQCIIPDWEKPWIFKCNKIKDEPSGAEAVWILIGPIVGGIIALGLLIFFIRKWWIRRKKTGYTRRVEEPVGDKS